MHCPAPRVTFQAGPTRSSSSTTTAAGRLQTTARGCCSRRRKTSDAQRDTRWCTAGSMASSCAAPLGWVILSIYLFSYLILSLSLKYLYLISWAGRAPLIHHPSCGCAPLSSLLYYKGKAPLLSLLISLLYQGKAPLLSLLFSSKGRPFSLLFSWRGPSPLSSLLY
jgi:hypothetical protein